VRLRFRVYDSLWRYRPIARAFVRLNSPASSKKQLSRRRLSILLWPCPFVFLLRSPFRGSSAYDQSRLSVPPMTIFGSGLLCLVWVPLVVPLPTSFLLSFFLSRIHFPASLGSSDRYSPSVRSARSCGLPACLRYYGRSDSCPSALLRPVFSGMNSAP
jgi:hypothetical protein